MVDPVATPLALVGLLFPIYDACDRLYHGYKLTRSFGRDFRLTQLQLEQQYSRLELTSETRVVDIQGLDRLSDINDVHHRLTATVFRTLSSIKDQFELAHQLIQHYDKKGIPTYYLRSTRTKLIIYKNVSIARARRSRRYQVSQHHKLQILPKIQRRERLYPLLQT